MCGLYLLIFTICYDLNVCVLPEILIAGLNRWGLCKVIRSGGGAFPDEFSVLVRDPTKLYIAPSSM